MGIYLTAQVCLNGHAITSSLEHSPELAAQFCPDCGESTIHICQQCNTNIRGEYYVESVVALSYYTPPQYCHQCGAAFPWMLAKVNAAKELADELDDLAVEQREKLKEAIEDLSIDSPKTELAALRYNKIVSRIGKVAANSLKKIMVDVATETAKKAIFGNGL